MSKTNEFKKFNKKIFEKKKKKKKKLIKNVCCALKIFL